MAVGKDTVYVPQGGTGVAGESPPPPVFTGRGCSSYSGGSNHTAVGGDDIRHTSRLNHHQHLKPNCSRRGGKWASECRFATLNVRGGLNEKLNEVYELINERKLDILCVNETKRKGKDMLTRGPFTEIWSGVTNEEHGSKGVGIILSERMAECMREYECVSARLIWVRMKVGLTPLFLVGVYAPDSSHSKAVREEFWEQLREIVLLRKENERIVMLGDFNARVGVKRDGYENVLGTFGDKNVNDNGVYLLDLCVEMGLSVMNTWFQHKMIHMYTWRKIEGDIMLRSMIDLIIVDERMRMKVVDTRAYRGADVGTDHYLVISRISGLFKRWRHRAKVSTTELERIKVERLKDQYVKEMYKKQLSECLNKSRTDVMEESVNVVWSVIKNNIVKCAEDVCGVTKRRGKKCYKIDWWDDETRRIVEEKKIAWLDILAIEATNRVSGGLYEDNVKEMKSKYRCVKAKVKECIERKKNEKKEKYEKNFGTSFRDNVKLFWKLVKEARGKSMNNSMKVIRDERGEMMREERIILECWKNYFESLFEKDVSEIEQDEMIDMSTSPNDEIGMEEIMKALRGMRLGKSAGYDRVTTEMLKAGDGLIVSLLHRLFNLCWKQGQVPDDWTKAVIVPIYKGKGSQQECQNYRGISLLSVVGKVYARILIDRVMNVTNDKIWDVQAGFRKGMGCTDQVFSLRCVTEKCLAKNQKVYCAFIDLEKAYDRVNRKELWKVLSMYGVDNFLIRALKSLYKDSRACVRINGAYSNWFHISKGVRQGCTASPWLFNLFIDSCMNDMREVECGINMEGVCVKCLLYADDQVILASSANELQQMMDCMNESFKAKGMKVNARKTKVIVFEKNESLTECNIVIEDENIEQVKEFVYLGSMFTRDGKCEGDIERRVTAGNCVNGALNAFMNGQTVPKEARLAVHNGVLVPTLMYGSESWVWQKKHESRINAVEMRSLRSMCGVRLIDRIPNVVIRECCGLKEDVVTRIEKGMLRWFGHVERMSEERMTKQIYKANVFGQVGRGRPRRTFVDQIGDVLKKGEVRSTRNRRACMKRIMNVEEARDVCKDRSKWRSVVSAYPDGKRA